MSTNLSIVPSEGVSSVGNAWIVCRSKSYAGRIYYFNTSTGETVWNLSEPEIQKAKAMTKIFKSQSGLQPDDCPEPVHSPEDPASLGPSIRTDFKYHNMTPAKIYNKLVINNQFTQASDKPYSNQLSNYNVSNANQLNIPVTPTVNGLRNLAPEPIFVAPTPIAQLQHVPNFNRVPVTATTESLSNRFKIVSNNKLPNKVNFRGRRRNFKHNFKNNELRKNNFKQQLQNKTRQDKNVDLRFVISSKRSSFNNIDFIQPSSHTCSTTFSDLRNAHTSHKNTLRENKYNILNDDDMWLEENLQSQGKTDKLDATPLKSYFEIENSHPWYIIADSDALLNNVNFLNILLNSDKQCHLIVPQIVMTIVQKATNSRHRTAAHRAVYFISQQVDAKLATIVPHDEDNEGGTDEKHCIITCCSNLMKQDFHVIILTNSIELNVLKETGEMPILTITEIKKILSKSQSNESIESSKLMDSRSIKITIPNTNTTTTNLISPLKIKTDQAEIEVDIGSDIIEYENVTNSSSTSPIPIDNINTNCIKRLDRIPEITKKTENDRKNYKSYSRKSKRKDSVDSLTKSNKICKSKNSNLESSESVKIRRNEDTSENSTKNVNIEDISEISNTNTETRSEKASKSITKEIMDCENVMFEVTGQSMEDYLKMKSDEWVSRFIQIMEEVLAQILQQEPKFFLEALPPPWTVYEATECIKRKFKSDSDVLDAANKLLNVLFELGGLRGKIKNDLSPGKYMEMYSFGVYLIDALQGLLSNSEDLQAAAESLSKLLSDIQNPHLDPCNQDNFDLHPDREIRPQDDKNSHQNEINEEKVDNELEKFEVSVINTESLKIVNTPNTKRDDNSTPDTPRQYNLRSNRKRILQDKEDVIFIRHLDIESSFFSCLKLRKDFGKGIFSKIISNTPSEIQNNVESKKDQTPPEINSGDNNVGNKKGPTFIRNITKCIEFEKKIKERSEVSCDTWSQRNEGYEDYEEELDYESMEEGYYMNGECNYNDEMYEDDDNPDEIITHSGDTESQEDSSNDNINVDFKNIIQKLQRNIKEVYSVIHEFCKNSYEKLSTTDIDLDKNDILLAEKTYLLIENLCNIFNRILERETSNSEFIIQEVFKNKEFEGYNISEEHLEDYRSFINNCLLQGNFLKESVRIIVDTIKEGRSI